VITFLHGRLVHALPTQATIDVGGVGYEVFIPLSSYDKLPAVGQPIEISRICMCAKMRRFSTDSWARRSAIFFAC
jgi:Holliday junction resolvasome RuvABC DNA-binding subunit